MNTDWDQMMHLAPRRYVCHRAAQPLEINGDLTKPAWQLAPWTEAFVDIEGDPRRRPRFLSRVKMLWDDNYLYVGADLEEPHLWATQTEKNSVIYQDNDFEIFIDPDGDNHHYYEFEINVLNTIWELTLPKPYKDQGDPVLGTNLLGLKSAVKASGTINDPWDTDRGWTLEVALPWSGLAVYNPKRATPPQQGDQWRINFARVQWQHLVEYGAYRKVPGAKEENWVWSPQGVVDMHRPEKWGIVQFSTLPAGADDRFIPDPSHPARHLLMRLYYQQKAFQLREGRYFTDEELIEFLDGDSEILTSYRQTDHGYEIWVWAHNSQGGRYKLGINQDSRILK
jgi:hypothetical protein